MIGNALLTYAGTSDLEDPRITFWRDPSRWPQDAGGYIFAARALLRLGQTLLPAEWSDAAPLTEYVPELPEHLWLSMPREDIERAVRILGETDTAYNRRVGRGRGLLSNINESAFPTTAEWSEAVRLMKERQEATWPKLVPFFKAQIQIEYACVNNSLKSAIRSPEGGPIVDQEWHFWNYDFAWRRLDLCRVVVDEPHRLARIGERAFWIYFCERSLNEYLESRAVNDKAATGRTSLAEALVAERIKNERPAGRPSEYDWEEFAAELYRRFKAGTLQGADRAITASMLEWCQDRWGREPSESHARERVRQFLLAFAVADKSND